MRHTIILIFIFSLIGNAFAHDSDKDHPINYSFKDRIHGMCVGHYHLDDDQLKEICNHFPEHYSDILELQSNPPKSRPERYIRKLTVLVIFSDALTKDKKHEFYRRSYNQAVEAHKNGDEWYGLLGLLVERTDALTLPELQNLMKTTSHEPLKPLIEKAMDRMQRSSNIRHRPSVEESHELAGSKDRNTEQPSPPDEDYNRLHWFIAGVVILGIIALLLKTRKTKASS